jgi:hypothetical protein
MEHKSIFWLIKAYLRLRLSIYRVKSLEHRRVKRKRNRTLAILLFPVLIFIGFIGWCMYSMGDPKPKRQKAPYKNDNVTLIPIVFEDQQQIRNS